MTNDVLLQETSGQILWLTLNRPEAMNAFNFSLLAALEETICSIRNHRGIRVAIITGAGEKAFCTGADLKERISLTPEQVKNFIFRLRNAFTDLEHLPIPIIAAVNGYAFGGGLELAMACDLRVAVENTVMGLTETRLAIIPGAGGTQRLPRLVGVGKAKELIFTGKRISAAEALSIGLLNSVARPGQLQSEVQNLADMICETGPVAVEQAKFAINQGIETDLRTGLAIESNAYWLTIPTEDRLEGLAAFREKRKPVYKGC